MKLFETDRFFVSELDSADSSFICQLLNTESWLNFIGDKGVRTEADAQLYIEQLLADIDRNYWKVVRKDDGTKVGVVTLIKRDYLQNFDIGYGFLPQFQGKGYAFESANGLLRYLQKTQNLEKIQAIIKPTNQKSIKLIEKLGFRFIRFINVSDEEVMLFENSFIGSSKPSNR